MGRWWWVHPARRGLRWAGDTPCAKRRGRLGGAPHRGDTAALQIATGGKAALAGRRGASNRRHRRARTAPRTGPGTRPRLRRSAAPSPRPAAAPERCPRPRSPTARARPAQPRVGLRASHPPHRPPKPLTPCLSPGSFVVGAGTGKPLAPRLLFPRPPPPPPHAFGWEMPGTAEHRCPHPPPAPAPERAQEQSK